MSTDAVDTTKHSSHQAEYPNEIIERIESAATLAVETNDYLSFATVVDLEIGDPQKFTNEEIEQVLSGLFQILESQKIIIYKVGWDMLELLGKYVDKLTTSDVALLAAQTPFRLVMALFSLISEYGNPRELLLRSCELMLASESKRNIERIRSMSLEDKTADSCSFQDNDDFQTGFDQLVVSRSDNVKFCTLFEVIRFSLQRIDTPVPSSFLLEATSTLLQVANDPNADLLSIATYGRRMYLLARDFSMGKDCNVSLEEMARVRNILVNFLTHASEVLVKRFSLKYSERLFLQMRHKVMFAPPKQRENVYFGTECTRRMCEVTSRISQLMLSFDFDPTEAVHASLGVEYSNVDGKLVKNEHPGLPSTKVEGVEILANSHWARKILDGPSLSGLCVLKTQLHYDGTRCREWDVKMSALYSLQIFDTLQNTACKTDVLLYWALWTANFFSPETAREIEEPLLTRYLNMHLQLISSSECREEQFVTGSIIARALRFQNHDYSYQFCINVLKTSMSPAEHFVAVEALKALINCRQDSSDPCTKPIELTPERKHEIASVAREAMLRLKKHTHRFPFYYLNLLTVIPTDKQELYGIVDDVYKLTTYCEVEYGYLPESCKLQIKLLREAVDKLKIYADTL